MDSTIFRMVIEGPVPDLKRTANVWQIKPPLIRALAYRPAWVGWFTIPLITHEWRDT